jgi:hypothetical protein
MKKLLFTSVIFILAATSTWSQVQYEFVAGYSPAYSPKSSPTFVNRGVPRDEFRFNVIHFDHQLFAGMRIRLAMSEPFFLEGGVSYTRRSSSFLVNYTIDSEIRVDQVMTTSENIILLPVNVGLRLGPVEITSGLSLHKRFGKDAGNGNLNQLDGFNCTGNAFSFGYQAAVRYPFHRMTVGIEYQGLIQRICQGMAVGNKSLEVLSVPGLPVFTVQYQL